MATSSSTVYLVTGANSGIGLGLATRILETHATSFVYAGARDPSCAQALKELQARHPARLEIVKCVCADVAGNVALARAIAARHGRLDTVITSAGTLAGRARGADVSPAELEENFYVDVVGTIVLYQALCGLMRRSARPRFVTLVASGGACLAGGTNKVPAAPGVHGASKAALDWATQKMHLENEWLVVFPLSPGPVGAEMVHNSPAAPLLALVDSATRDKHGDEFVHVDGTHIAW